MLCVAPALNLTIIRAREHEHACANQTREKERASDLHELVAKGDNVDLAMAGMYQPGMNTSTHIQNMGIAAMLRLRSLPEADLIAGGRG